jgi:rod shape determining protein RodA
VEPLKDFVRQVPDLNKNLSVYGTAKFFRLDTTLLFLLTLLVVIGLLILYSASGKKIDVVYKQLVFIGIGYVAMWMVSMVPLVLMRTWTPILYIFGLGLLVAVLTVGVGAKGAQRWLDLGVTRFQPSELIKLFVPMSVAWYLGKKDLPPRLGDIAVVLIIIALPASLILKQPDLGTSLLVLMSGIFVLWLAGLRLRHISLAIMCVLVAIYPIWHYVLKDYQKGRILTLLNPGEDKLGAGWNIMQSTTAIGSGGMSGKGWLEGTQSHLNFLPESHTDFIIAVLAEEFGLVGVFGLLSLYLLILCRCLYLSWRTNTLYGQLLGGAISLTFFVYIFVNLGMVSGMLPVVGVPLPLISQGGTSIVSLFLGFGIIMLLANRKRSLNV